jgi:hypothetical protein
VVDEAGELSKAIPAKFGQRLDEVAKMKQRPSTNEAYFSKRAPLRRDEVPLSLTKRRF